MSIKDLAIKVLERNSQRNQSETPSFTKVKFEGEKVSCVKPDETGPLPLPFINQYGDLVIPFGSDPRYHWWRGGQSVKETIEELKSWVH